MTQRRLEAPHRRLESGSRLFERAVVVAYKGAATVLAHVPPRLSQWVIATGSQASYLLWPAKRRFSNINFSHVLGLPNGHPKVRALALRAYREYAKYVVELMRLPSRPADELASAVLTPGLDELVGMWRDSGGPVIVVAGHVGNNEAAAAGIAGRGIPVSVVADDSSFPELFDLLRRQRESWGVKVVPWRNLRGLFAVLRNNEVLALLVDWGYRPDGVPVRRRSPPRRERSSCRSRSGASPTADSGWRAASRSASPRQPPPTSSARPRRSPMRSRTPSAPRRSSGTASSRAGRPIPRQGPSSKPARRRCLPARPIPGRRGHDRDG